MSPGPSRRSHRSLRTRLLIAFVVPLVLVLALVGVVSVTALRSELGGQVDAQLAAAANRAQDPDRGRGRGDDGGRG
ncbi:hypothetical protein A7K94_0217095, partial [Modestobacter sp. VKM Ac-2676]